MENQPNPLDVFKKFTFDEVKAALQDFLSDGGEETPAPAPVAAPTTNNYTLDSSKSKSKVDKFDDLFSDDKNSDDGLPF